MGSCEESVVGAHAAARWALPEPEGAAGVALRAPGGPRTQLALDALGATHQLLYQNFIYVAFSASAAPKAADAANAANAAASPPDRYQTDPPFRVLTSFTVLIEFTKYIFLTVYLFNSQL